MHQKGRMSLVGEQPKSTFAKTYRMKFMEDGLGLQKDIEFEAHDAATAFAIAHREASNRLAELWCDGQKLCTIRRTAENFWEIR